MNAALALPHGRRMELRVSQIGGRTPFQAIDLLRGIGEEAKHRLLVVCFAAQEGSARIFSARKATKQERKDHEGHTRGRDTQGDDGANGTFL